MAAVSGVLRRRGAGPSGGGARVGRAAEAIQEIRPQIEDTRAFCAGHRRGPGHGALACCSQTAVDRPDRRPRTLDQ